MKLKKFLITGLAIMNFIAPLNTYAADEANKTAFTSQEISITEELLEMEDPIYTCSIQYYLVRNESGEALFGAYSQLDDVYTTSSLNLRVMPSTESEKFVTLPKNAKIQRIGQSEVGWDIIRVGDKNYFVWNEFITTEAPQGEIIEITEENIQSYKEIYLGTYRLTAYCSCKKCCGKWSGLNKTASGATPRSNHTAACNSLPFGTKVRINGVVYTIEDRGNMAGDIIDIYFDSHEAALNSGFGLINAEVYKVN